MWGMCLWPSLLLAYGHSVVLELLVENTILSLLNSLGNLCLKTSWPYICGSNSVQLIFMFIISLTHYLDSSTFTYILESSNCIYNFLLWFFYQYKDLVHILKYILKKTCLFGTIAYNTLIFFSFQLFTVLCIDLDPTIY